MGPMTGRAAGHCAGYGVPGYTNPIPGRGRGFGGGRGYGRGLGLGFRGGRGWGGRWAAPVPYGYPAPYAGPVPYSGPTRQQEVDALKGQAEYLRNALEDINGRLAELESEKSSD
jgi:hypothetical protein